MHGLNRNADRHQVKVLAVVIVIVVVAYYLVDENPDPEGWFLTVALLFALVGVGFLLTRR